MMGMEAEMMGMEVEMMEMVEMRMGMKMEQGHTDISAQLMLDPSVLVTLWSPPWRGVTSTGTAWGCFSFLQPSIVTRIYEDMNTGFKCGEATGTNPLQHHPPPPPSGPTSTPDRFFSPSPAATGQCDGPSGSCSHQQR